MMIERPVKPDAVTPVPTPVPSRTNWANFAVLADKMMAWFPGGISAINVFIEYVNKALLYVEERMGGVEGNVSDTEAARDAALAAQERAEAAAAATGGAFPPGASRGMALVSDGANGVLWRDIYAPAIQITRANVGALLEIRRTYHINSSAGAFSLIMPLNAPTGAWVYLIDVGLSASNSPVTLQRNGELFWGLAEDFVMDVSGAPVMAIKDELKGWITI